MISLFVHRQKVQSEKTKNKRAVNRATKTTATTVNEWTTLVVLVGGKAVAKALSRVVKTGVNSCLFVKFCAVTVVVFSS